MYINQVKKINKLFTLRIDKIIKIKNRQSNQSVWFFSSHPNIVTHTNIYIHSTYFPLIFIRAKTETLFYLNSEKIKGKSKRIFY